jgi:hypothetical protein
MSDPVDALILDLPEWIGPRPRPYAGQPTPPGAAHGRALQRD